MVDVLKPLFVVLVFSFVVFRLAKPICLKFTEAVDFERRRNVWFALTVMEFLIPNYWAFSVLALVLVFWAGSKDRHPTALYSLLAVCIPPCEMLIPLPLVNQLFGLSPIRMLALALVIPACFRFARAGIGRWRGVGRVDAIVLAYGALQLILYSEFEAPTNTLRRAVLFGIDVYALYYMFSRGATSRRAMADTLACISLTAAIQVPIAVFETTKGWLLYTLVGDRWGMPNLQAWLFRGDALRAQGPGGHSLALGFMLAMGFGAWMYLGRRLESKRTLLLVGVYMWAGLVATYSRAPWLVAALAFIVYSCFAPGGVKNMAKSLVVGICAVVALSFTPFGEKLISILPFIGTHDQDNIDYRTQLATVSWRLIKEHPWFGNPFALGEMEDLRQGQGIIDLVNTYASIALFYGSVGLALFVTSFVYPLGRTFMAVRRLLQKDTELAGLGVAVIALTVGLLFMMSTSSLGDSFAAMAWSLAGLCSAFPFIGAYEIQVNAQRLIRPVRRAAFS